MDIGIVGSGKIGTTLVESWVHVEHEIWIANRRGPSSLDHFATYGDNIHPATVIEARDHARVIVLAIPYGAYSSFDPATFDGKILVDATNYVRERDGAIEALESASITSSELLQAHFGAATVVKAFNSIFWEHLRDDGTEPGGPERRALPMAGDDRAAKSVVAGLVDGAGFDSVDAGSLFEGRRFQRGTPPYVQRYTRSELAAALQWVERAPVEPSR